ncbi:MAG: zinc ribbon domain-containing protein [candidate division Zixibacteria bacterium]|nr:zinc ribbon domain-containing protein [candidate division Zixibacteria bacterium]
MPIYEYICKKCKNRFEILIRNNKAEVICPGCGGAGERVFSVFGFSSGGKFVPSNNSSCSSCSSKNCGDCK